MLKIKTLFILLNFVFFSYNLLAQKVEALAGANGIFISFGKQLPKDFSYLLERRVEESNENWRIIYSSNFPKDIASLKSLLFRINTKNPFYQLPDSSESAYFYKKISAYNSSDSISFYNGNPVFIEAMGSGYFDTGIKPGMKYEYRITKIGVVNQKTDIQTTKSVSFPGKAPEYFIQHYKTVVQGSKINSYYHIKGNHKPFGFKVFRQYTLQSPFQEIEPVIKYYHQNDSLFLYLSDNEVSEKMIYRYFIQPYDLLGNTGANSDTILVSNVKEYGEVPLLSSFKSTSLEDKRAICLSWRFPDVANLRSISVYRSENFDKDYQHLINVPASDTSYLDSRIEPVKTYYYYLVIHGAYGDSPPTSKVAGMLKSSLKLVTPPQNVRVEKVADGNKITWRRIESGTIGYYIYRGEGYRPELKQYTNIIHSDSLNVSFIDSIKNLKAGQPYTYAVASVNINSLKSPLSATVIANPTKPTLPTPLNLQVLQNPNGAFLIWEDMVKISPYVIGYRVFRTVYDDLGKVIEAEKIVNTGKETSGNNSYLDTAFQRGINYSYAIQAIGIENSESERSYEVGFFVPKITPHPPSGLRAFKTTESIIIQWDTPLAERIKSFKVYRQELDKNLKLLAELKPEVTEYEDKISQKSKNYFYKVSVVSAEGIESAMSEEVGVHF